MSLIGPCLLKIGAVDPVDYGDFVTNIIQNPPAPVVLSGINRDFSSSPKRGYNITLTGVAEDLADGTLWAYLWENFDTKDVPVVWSPLADSDEKTYFTGVIASIPDPKVGGQANQHGTFDITLTLKERPTRAAAPA